MSYPDFEKKVNATDLYPDFITADESLRVETVEDVEKAKKLQLAHNNQYRTAVAMAIGAGDVAVKADAELEPDKGNPEDQCGACTLCQKKCLSGAIMGDGYFHARQCESIINVSPNKRYYNKNVNQDCDMCLRVCPKGEMHWRREV